MSCHVHAWTPHVSRVGLLAARSRYKEPLQARAAACDLAKQHCALLMFALAFAGSELTADDKSRVRACSSLPVVLGVACSLKIDCPLQLQLAPEGRSRLCARSSLPVVTDVARSLTFAPAVRALADRVIAGISAAGTTRREFNAAHLRLEKDARDWSVIMGGEAVRPS